MISTKDLASLPGRQELYLICKSISVLDAVFSEEWLDRYYSFNSKWATDEEFFEMRNGQGDQFLILFLPDGCVINGMTHEYYPKDKNKLTARLPEKYHEFIFGEPVHSIGTTFCIWNAGSEWTIGDVTDFKDGSSEVLQIFNGDPETYIDWATEYFEIKFGNRNAALDVVRKVYQGSSMTKDMVFTLNKDFAHWKQLREDLIEIDYPASFV